jgi:hypothetical protein
MKREIITIEHGMVSVPQSGEVCMTVFEIASLFEVYTQTINAHIKALLESGVIRSDISCSATVTRNAIMPDFYRLDMIIALAFRVHSPKAGICREWVLHRITTHFNPLPLALFIQLSKGALYN